MDKLNKGHTDDDEIDENQVEGFAATDGKTAKKHKHRKNKEKQLNDLASGEADSSNKKQKKKEKKTHEDSNGAENTKKNKKKRKRSPGLEDNNAEANIVPDGVPKEEMSEPEDLPTELQLEAPEELEFPEQDLPVLLNRIEGAIPYNDTVAFRTRIKKLDWSAIAFGNYSAEKCQETWVYMQKRQRQFRLLSEMVQDAKEWVRKPYKGKGNMHPDFPKRPLSSYMLYYLHRKDKVISENAGIKMPDMSRKIAHDYNELPEQEKAKYNKLAADRRQQFEIELEEFYTRHPEMQKSSDRPAVEIKLPKKPRKAFTLFLDDQLKKEGQIADRGAFKEQCKETWKNLPDDKKKPWIDTALELKNKYQEQVNREQMKYNQLAYSKPTMSKKEKRLVDRMDGKPDKPPNSAYSLYSRILLKGDELKDLNPIERMKTIAIKWKELPQEEKDSYRNKANCLVEQYKLDYASYLDSLPQEKRELELQMSAPKRKVKAEEMQFEIKKTKIEDEMPKEKTTNSLIDTVIPQTWEDMDDGERSMYVKYVQKIKDYFDTQHQAAIEEDNVRSDTDSESSE